MSASVQSILYVRFPCWKIYPGGMIYVADFIHKSHPEIEQHILDFALIEKRDRRRRLIEEIRLRQPDVVAFSWRNMQSFGPNPDDDALDVVMNFQHSSKPHRRLKAAYDGLSIIYEYLMNRLNNFRYMKLVRRMLPKARIVVGGSAVSVFGRYVAEKCPTDTTVVVGEGQDAMLGVVEGRDQPLGEVYYKDRSGVIRHHPREEIFDLREETAVDFPYIESIFPDFHKHLDDYVGVHTKRGCPYNCHFCLYNKIEGVKQRYRDPVEVVDEVEMLSKRYGVKKIWFTDAQFCSTKPSTVHMEKVLDLLLERQIRIQWTGYVRLNYITPQLAQKMIDSGLASLDLSFTGSQEVIDALRLGYRLDEQMETLRMFRDAGHTNQKLKLYLPVNAPGETAETLLQTIVKIKQLYSWFGRENVLPFIFFIGIQPGTPVEAQLKEEGYLPKNYNPLTYNPYRLMRLLYNPKPLGPIIAKAYLAAMATLDPDSEYIGRATFEHLEPELRRLVSFPSELGDGDSLEAYGAGGQNSGAI